VCAFSTCRICGRTGLAVCRAINVGCSCPISDLSVRQSQRPPPPPLRPCPGRAHEPPSAPNPVDLWATQERASPTNPQVQQQQQASAYSVPNGVERVPTLDPHANPVSEIHRPASRRTPGRDHPGIPGDIISERWGASSRNPRAASAESAAFFCCARYLLLCDWPMPRVTALCLSLTRFVE
jgi:hypothetical protein